MSARALVTSRLPIVFGFGEAEAAASIGIGTTLFRQMVLDGRMPRPRLLNGRRVWDVDDLRSAFKSLPMEGETATVNEWD